MPLLCTYNLVLFCALYLSLSGNCHTPLILRCHCCTLLLELLCTSNLDLQCPFTALPLLYTSQLYFTFSPVYPAMDLSLNLVTALPCSDTTVHLYPCLVPGFIFILVLTLPFTSNLVLALLCTSTALHIKICLVIVLYL